MCDCRTSKRAGLRTPQDVVAEDTVVLLHGDRPSERGETHAAQRCKTCARSNHYM